eukprot:34277-Prorocentrum_minimum.AAC.2
MYHFRGPFITRGLTYALGSRFRYRRTPVVQPRVAPPSPSAWTEAELAESCVVQRKASVRIANLAARSASPWTRRSGNRAESLTVVGADHRNRLVGAPQTARTAEIKGVGRSFEEKIAR